MRFTRHIVHTALALWLCLGAQMHLSLNHVTYWEHGAEDHHTAPAGDAEGEAPSLHCACGNIGTSHHHDSPPAVHEHELDAITVKPSHRALQLIAAAMIPVQSVEIRVPAEPAVFDLAPARIVPLYLSQESTPRAPPVA